MAYSAGFPPDRIGLWDFQAGEHRVLVRRDQAFPGAYYIDFPSFLPDEQRVIFDVAWKTQTHGAFWDLAIVDVRTGEVEYIDAPGTANMEPLVSPDGRWILVRCEGRQPGSGFSICLIDAQTLTRTYLVEEATNIAVNGLFTPDSQSVVYAAPVSTVDREHRLYRIDISDRQKHLLVSGLVGSGVTAVTQDEVLFTCRFTRDNPACYWMCAVRLDGTDLRRLTFLGERCRETP